MDPLEKILSKIENLTNIPKEELLERVNKKYNDLSGLITIEGAAFLLAKELGVNLSNEAYRQLKIKNIVPAMRNLNVIGRIFKISPINEFERTDSSKGKVVNLFIADNTGYLKLPLWNEQVKLVEEEEIKLGDVIQIVNGLAKENIFGGIEISLGKYGTVKQIEDNPELPTVEELMKKLLSYNPERANLKDITPGYFEVNGTVATLFKGNFLFNVCSLCGNSLKETNKGYRCEEHGDVEPNPALVMSCIIDDGTDDMRIIFFRELAEKLCGITAKELSGLDVERRYELMKGKLLGRELLVTGRVKKNKRFNRLEMIADSFKDLNILEESKELAEELELRVGE